MLEPKPGLINLNNDRRWPKEVRVKWMGNFQINM